MSPRGALGACAGVALLLVAVLLQVTELASSRVLGGTPDLALVVLVLLALRAGSELGALLGFASGIALDVLAQHALGRDALVLTFVAYAAGRVGERVRGRALVRTALTVAAASIAMRIGQGMVVFLLGESDGLARAFSASLISSPALAVLLALAILPLVRRLLGRRPEPVASTRFAPLEASDATAAA